MNLIQSIRNIFRNKKKKSNDYEKECALAQLSAVRQNIEQRLQNLESIKEGYGWDDDQKMHYESVLDCLCQDLMMVDGKFCSARAALSQVTYQMSLLDETSVSS